MRFQPRNPGSHAIIETSSPATVEEGLRYLAGSHWRRRMKKALAILATVATVAATTLTAPAQARGVGPGVGLRSGSRRNRRGGRRSVRTVLWAGLWLLRIRPSLLLWIRAVCLLRGSMLSAPLLAQSLVIEKPGALPPGFFFFRFRSRKNRRAKGRFR